MIRPATEQDCKALGVIYCLSWKEAYKNIISDEYLDSLTIENCTPGKINSIDNLVAEDNGNIIGVVNFGKSRDENSIHEGELRAIYVLPDFWMKGFGKILFSSAAKKLEESGFLKFYLWVLKDNYRARRFYEKMGMLNTSVERRINIGGRDIDEVKYEFYFKK